MRFARPRSLLAAGAVCVVGAVGAVTVVTSASAAAGCAVTYRVGSQWPGGFSGSVDLTNLGDPLNGWTLTWSFTAGQQVSQGWNAVFSQSGAQVTARNQTWNAGLGTGAVVNLGFNGSWNNSANPAPTSFALNGVACTGSTTPTTAPTTTSVPTTAPPTTPPPTTPPTTTGPPRTFTNPIKLRGPDPWLTHYNGYYYLATTTWNNTITMRRSRTLGGLASAPDTLLFTLTR
ncbi:cellulose-binding domain-containing protein, partial [Phytohabitans kaempferiae]